MSKRIVLAYSGGLDTSCCLTWLKDKGYKVYCFVADIGQGDDFSKVKAQALKIGAEEVFVKDLKKEFANDYILPALKANAVYEGKYLLATALSRPLIAKHLVQTAKEVDASFVAHGSTGKGNDQVRIEVGVSGLNPKLGIVAPVREWELKSREEEIEYIKSKGIGLEVTKKKPYSIDKNLWGVSIEGGVLENIDKEPPADCYQLTKKEGLAAKAYINIEFTKGKPGKLNGKKLGLVELITKLNDIGAKFGIGRTDLIEDRLVGIKSREIYEAPAGWILFLAHKELESICLDKETLNFKQLISTKYAQLVYDGLWFSALKTALDTFIQTTQEKVSGTVRCKLTKENCTCVGRKSKQSLYKKELATYSKHDRFDHTAAEGFIKIWGLPYLIQGLERVKRVRKG